MEPDPAADELLERALLDPGASAAVALKVSHLTVADALTVVFHGRQDLGTVQTYVTHGPRGAGEAVRAAELLRVPCDLDLAEAHSRDEAAELYADQARALRDALQAADAVLALWLQALAALADTPVGVDRSVELPVRLPAHRLMPIALTAPDRRLTVTPVCSARTLAEGRPPLGIACAQQDVAHVYPLHDDPEACLQDLAQRAAQHARELAGRLDKGEANVRHFLDLVDDEPGLAH